MILPIGPLMRLMLRASCWCHLLAAVIPPGMPLVLGASLDQDPTGVSSALQDLARLLAGMVVGVACLALVVCGLLYITAFDDVSRAMHVRRAIGAIVVGLLLVVLATTIAPQLIAAIQAHAAH
ncbi:MAG: TrbC/VirB2 family protein [Thermogemmatispora sp.]|uniref:TrbC/VirB2 family protein n=1 Tax=Thermogemmatispora sp. TaxID=1968838 RepID=UPI0019E3F809|nr:TrbC/VirB2 family protein [Thermogemmatispora sp.]MBE3568047.1 TrbC/VirB2 family protein [Thermogemmatispora sp.]